MGTNTVTDQNNLANLNPVMKHDMISYQEPDGTINNKLPPVNGMYHV